MSWPDPITVGDPSVISVTFTVRPDQHWVAHLCFVVAMVAIVFSLISLWLWWWMWRDER